MDGSLLPDSLIQEAFLLGGEYAWPLRAVEEALETGKRHSLACLGGQVQFRLPDGTCELYWCNADAGDRLSDEPWPIYVERSTEEVIHGFQRLRREHDFIEEGVRGFAHLAEKQRLGIDLSMFVCFVLYFVSEPVL